MASGPIYILLMFIEMCAWALWNYIRLPARDGPILVFTACCHTGTVYTIAASLHVSLLAIDILLESLLERAALREE